MSAEALPLDGLPRQNASQVKNKWGEVVRLARKAGGVAITSHSKVEMVLLDAEVYQSLAEQADAFQSREAAVLDDLSKRFDARLVALRAPGARQKVQALLKSRGKLTQRPRAGTSY
jgi:prevent-host-death family protein